MAARSLQRPIFLLASERSGTNLLRVICGSHPDISAPTPPHLLMTFTPLLPSYADLSAPGNFRRLCEDVARSLSHQLGSWTTRFEADELVAAVREPSFTALFDHIYFTEQQAVGATRTFFKENQTWRYAYKLLREWPDAQFVYLSRDARDFAASFLDSPVHFGTVRHSAELWRSQQRECLSLYQELRAEGRVHGLHYEDMITCPEDTVTALCEFLGLDYRPEMLNFHTKRENVQASKLYNWKHLRNPIMKQNRGQYRDKLSAAQVFTVEAVAYREMRQLGYTTDNPVEALLKSRNFGELFTKGRLFLSKALRGRLMSWDEMKLRRRRVMLQREMMARLDANAEVLIPQRSAPG